MGKKGKKKGPSEAPSAGVGPSQTASQPQAPTQPPRQPQRVEAPVAPVTQGIAQLGTGPGPAARGGPGGDGATGQSQRQDAGRGGRKPRMGRGQQPGMGRGQQPGMGRGQQPGMGRGQQPQVQQYIPGMQSGPPPGQAQALQPIPGMQSGPPPGQAQARQPIPGMQSGPPPGQAHARQPIPGMQSGPPPGQGQAQQGAYSRQAGPGQAGASQGQVRQEYPPAQQQIPGMAQGQGRGQGSQHGRGGQRGGGQDNQRGRGGQSHGEQRGRDPGYTPASQPSGSRQSSAPSPARSTVSTGSGKSASKPAPSPGPVKTSISKAEQDRQISLIPKRQNPNKGGTAGRRITVETNMIPITFEKNFVSSIVQYDVKFDPEKPKFMLRPIMEAVQMKHYPKLYPAFDGRCNLFAAGPLPFGDALDTEVPVWNRERQVECTYKVSLRRAQDIAASWLKNVRPGLIESEREQIAIQAVDVILRSVAMRRQAKAVGRSLFLAPERGGVLELGGGMDLWIGTFQSVILGWKPYFNVDVAHKGFPKNQPVLNLIGELCGGLTAREVDFGRRKLQEYLKGLKVTYEIPGQPGSKRTWGINDLGKSARDASFELDDGSVATVENYFALKKRYKIRYPDLPTLWVGSRQKLILIPVELCEIEAGQVTNKKLDERQTSTMIKHAATNTATRKQKIMDGFSKMKFNEDPALKEFGISVGRGFDTVNARVLDPPSLTDKRPIMVRKGVWRANGFQDAMVLPDKSWTILNLNFRTQDPALRGFVAAMKNAGAALGMQIGEPITPFAKMDLRSRDVRQIVQFFQEKKKEGLKLIVVVVPDKTGPEYGRVKQVAELNVGVLTQCIKAVTIERKMNDATAGNILLKVNAKLNGTNQIFTAGKLPGCLKRPCMIVGADVTHPSPDAQGIPSIAAVAASYNPNAFRYNIEIRLQPPRTEIIQHLQEIMKKQLLFFYQNSRQKPEHIIFYRDGVSEGQFAQVMHHELQAIRNACSGLGGANPYQPAITFLVVQKRHHIRMFPTDPRNSDDRNGNVQAGTVVDTDITHPSDIDFYLVSHASIQGTARPTKYRCLWNDNNMSEDEIEQLTYYLCHMFSRCTRSVSYPAPTYYAHLAAFRARALTNEVEIRLNNLDEEQRTKMTIKPEILTGNPMFFV